MKRYTMHPARINALRLGEKEYFTGEACVNNHMARRSTRTGQCNTCRREQKRAFDKRRPEGLKSESQIEHEAMARSLPEGYIPGARLFLMGKQVNV